MCCQLSVEPLNAETAHAVLLVGQFKQLSSSHYERAIPEEGCVVRATIGPQGLDLTIRPAISVYGQHLRKRITAGVYFEIAAKYAEKVGGQIVQRATVTGCKLPESDGMLLVARYPEMPLTFDRVCAGFQAVINGCDDEPPADDWHDEPIAW